MCANAELSACLDYILILSDRIGLVGVSVRFRTCLVRMYTLIFKLKQTKTSTNQNIKPVETVEIGGTKMQDSLSFL